MNAIELKELLLRCIRSMPEVIAVQYELTVGEMAGTTFNAFYRDEQGVMQARSGATVEELLGELRCEMSLPDTNPLLREGCEDGDDDFCDECGEELNREGDCPVCDCDDDIEDEGEDSDDNTSR